MFFPIGKRRFCLFCWGAGELYFRVRKVWLEVKGRLLSSALCGLLGCLAAGYLLTWHWGGGPVPPQGKHKAPTPFVFLNGSCESRRTLGDRCWCRTQILPSEPCVLCPLRSSAVWLAPVAGKWWGLQFVSSSLGPAQLFKNSFNL